MAGLLRATPVRQAMYGDWESSLGGTTKDGSRQHFVKSLHFVKPTALRQVRAQDTAQDSTAPRTAPPPMPDQAPAYRATVL